MTAENQIPALLQFMFGEAAELAQRGASARLLRWSEAMDEWLAERQRNYSVSTGYMSKAAWRRLLPQCGLPPWEIGLVMCCLSSFFRWCCQQEFDPQ